MKLMEQPEQPQLARVQKIIANAGIMSRRKAETCIEDGRVTVNGEKITIGDKATDTDVVAIDGKPISKVRKKYIMFNKPGNCLTTLHDPEGRPTIFRYLNLKERLIPVGRLDFKTEGLLLLTNDGDFANKIMHPSHGIKKKYHVILDQSLNERDKAILEAGVMIEDEQRKTSPCKIYYIDERNKAIVAIIIHEGRNRIVRKLFYSRGYKTKKLMRTQIGQLQLGELKKGRHRDLSLKEVEKIFAK